MKKILSIIGAVAVSSTATTSVVACDNKPSNPTPTYNSIEDAIKTLDLISYSKVGATNLVSLAENITQDINCSLLQINFKEGVNLETPITIDQNDILIGTKKITLDDLKTDTVLQLNVSIKIGDSSTKIKAKSWTLNVTTKTDQQVIDYINKINFAIFSKNVPIAKDSTIDKLKTQLPQAIIFSAGTFGISFISPNNITINKIFKNTTTTEITDDDLKTVGILNITANYKYGSVIVEQKINNTIKVGADLSTANTSIMFYINANKNSTNFFVSKYLSQEIKVTITNPAP